MAVMKTGALENPNGSVLSSPSVVEDENERHSATGSPSSESVGITDRELDHESTLYGFLNHLIDSVFDHHNSTATSTVNWIKESVQNTRRDVVLWTSRGSRFRALLVVSVGTIALVALTGMLVFLLIFLAATVNAVMISLLVSLAAVGGFLAIFFSCLTVIYTGALCIAASFTFTITISSIIAALLATGGIGIFWVVWLAATKSAHFVNHSLTTAHRAFPGDISGRQNAALWSEPGEVSD